ncbi:suppressor of fused domain protein [Streptomyces sp. NPDC087908]|uniref:suppressor of fused domain protein n=1 Tax=Streptomyces sp. NPDC087908 TaxID=3365820 RepID=UPI0037FB7109
MIDEGDRIAALERHVRGFWEGHLVEVATWNEGPVFERVPQFSTRRVLPVRAGGAWVYVTVGTSLSVPEGEGTEFLLMSPFADEAHSETLAMVSHYHSFDAHRLDVGSVVNLGRPWMRGSRMDHLLVSLPYPYGPDLEWSGPDAGEARFLWLLPVHKSEVDFIKRVSLDEFELLMDAASPNVLDPDRDPIV